MMRTVGIERWRLGCPGGTRGERADCSLCECSSCEVWRESVTAAVDLCPACEIYLEEPDILSDLIGCKCLAVRRAA